MRRTTTRRRVTAVGAAVAAGASILATLAFTAAPASAGSNGPTKYEVDCNPVQGSSGAPNPFIVTAVLSGATDPSYPTGASFSASGALSFTAQGPVFSAFAANGLLIGGQIGLNVTNVKLSSTDGSATGSYSYSHNFAAATPPHHTVSNVSWTSGTATLTGTGFTSSDIGGGLVGPGGDFPSGTAIIGVSATGATLSVAPTTTAVGANVDVYTAMTFTDASVSTGAAFTTNGSAGQHANVGVTAVDAFAFPGSFLTVVMGGHSGVTQPSDTTSKGCLVTGRDAANNPGPAQSGAAAPVFPAGVTTPLVAASGGFVSQPGTSQQITPPSAAWVALADPPPVASNADYNLGIGQTRTVTLPAVDNDATGVTGCALSGTPDDPRLEVTVSNSPTLCQATLHDTGSGPQDVTFQFTATDGVSSGNAGTATVHIGTPGVDESLGQLVNPGQLVLSCSSPDVYTVGGSPALQCADFHFADITLNGLQQVKTGAGSTLYVSDNRGDPILGWSLTASMIATPSGVGETNPNPSCAGIVAFCNASVGAHAIESNGRIAPSNLAISSIGCTHHAGNLNPDATAGADGTFASTRTLCTAAPTTSGGTFDVTKTYTLTIPSSVYAGQYWGTVEYLVQ